MSVVTSFVSMVVTTLVMVLMLAYAYQSRDSSPYTSVWIVSSTVYLFSKVLDQMAEVCAGARDCAQYRKYTFCANSREASNLQRLLLKWGIDTVCPSMSLSLWRKDGGCNGETWQNDASCFDDATSWAVTSYLGRDGTMGFGMRRLCAIMGSAHIEWCKGTLSLTLYYVGRQTELALLRSIAMDQDMFEPYEFASDRYIGRGPYDVESTIPTPTSTPSSEPESTMTTPLLDP
jgi:hypothetical protein